MEHTLAGQKYLLDTTRLYCIEKFTKKLKNTITQEFHTHFPLHKDDLYEGFVYFPYNPLAGIFKLYFYNGNWVMERNSTAVGIFYQDGESLVTYDDKGNITSSKIAYVPQDVFNDNMWLEWDDFEFDLSEGFQPNDGYTWYYKGTNTHLFPQIPGYPESWYFYAQEAFQSYTELYTYLLEQEELKRSQ